MSSYGPGGRPWGQPQDPYGQPSDPWGGNLPRHGLPDEDAEYDEPAPRQSYPGYERSAYGDWYGESARQADWNDAYSSPARPTDPAPVWTQHDPPRFDPPRRGSSRLLTVIIVVLALLVVSGGATALYLVKRENEPVASQPTPTIGPTGVAQPGGATTGPTGQSPTPAPEASAEARFAAKGQCLANDGTDRVPKMRIVACAGSTYEVLARFDGTTDFKNKCANVRGYQFHYFFDSELNVLDFVLCLKKH